MMEATTMEVNAEARRVLAVSISKLYASRTQRGGLRLHRSLLLSLVMRSARDIYHLSSPPPMECGTDEATEATEAEPPQPEPTPAEPSAATAAAGGGARQEADALDTEEEEEAMEEGELAEDKENRSPTSRSRKRRGKTSAAPDFLPSKRARLEPGEERHSAAAPPPVSCRLGPAESLVTLSLNRVIPAC
ncbi:immediate early response 2b [Nerophis ophidion]|uniref:immediate early response 2b n=1 Tax=Nerophis ophidion TaxID=159077 RepID=UPI002ADF10F1|nr:immediate early response 2b [Nerophis ophidion]